MDDYKDHVANEVVCSRMQDAIRVRYCPFAIKKKQKKKKKKKKILCHEDNFAEYVHSGMSKKEEGDDDREKDGETT